MCIVKLLWLVQHSVTVARSFQLWSTNPGPDVHLLAWRSSGSLSPWGCLGCHPSGNPAFAFLWDLMVGRGCSDYIMGQNTLRLEIWELNSQKSRGESRVEMSRLGKRKLGRNKERAVIRNHLKQCS